MPFPDSKSTAWEFFTDDYLTNALEPAHDLSGRFEVGRQSWKLHVDANGVRAACESPRGLIAFDRAAFSADPRLKDFRWVR